MDIRKLQRVIVDGLEDVKAQHIVVFNTEHLSALFERVIIASGTSNRQTKSLASSVRESVKDAGYPVPRLEGEGNGEWIIVDCGAAVVHVMQPTIREYYHLEEIWGDKPVNMKLGSSKAGLVKALEDDVAVAAPKRVPSAKTTRTRAAAPAAAKKSAARKTMAPTTVAARTVARKTTPAKTTPVKTTVRKTAGAKTSASKTPTSKTPARKTSAPAAPVVTRVVGVKRATPASKKIVAAKRPVARKVVAAKRPAARKTPARS